ncbi:hypothetical protein [Burkholderia ubonensis]|uniref:hypothetical protein n=1 Tax=Burkholderia ubonensis TaxID=101571 RepID=UPI0012FA3C94|nr:hypothetical protein [Burkholderia ubonensis]
MRDDLAVVGGGQSAKYLLLALAHAIAAGRLTRELRIGIYEEGEACGPGWAWHPANVDDIHLSSLASPAQRAAVGRDELLRFERIVAFLRELGAHVDVRCATHVVAIDRQGAGWCVTDAAGVTRGARDVVLAIGHSAFAERRPDGAHCMPPWPFDALCARTSGLARAGRGDVLVLGGYLTAVDVVTGLAARLGADPARLRMRVLSRTGELPKVWGAEPPSFDADAAACRAFGVTISRLRTTGRLGFEAFERIVLDAAHAGGGTRGLPASLDEWLRRLCAGDAAQRLKVDLAETAGGAVLDWQAALFGCLPLLSEAFPGFDDADKLRFCALRSRYYRAAMPMARENACRLDALFSSGVLATMAAPAGYRIEHDTARDVHRLWLRDAAGTDRVAGEFALVVAAAGPDARLGCTPSPLLRHLRERNVAMPVWACGEGKAVELGGVRVDPATCEMVSADGMPSAGDGRMFAMGPLVVGTFPDAQSVGHIARDAERIVGRLSMLGAMGERRYT